MFGDFDHFLSCGCWILLPEDSAKYLGQNESFSSIHRYIIVLNLFMRVNLHPLNIKPRHFLTRFDSVHILQMQNFSALLVLWVRFVFRESTRDSSEPGEAVFFRIVRFKKNVSSMKWKLFIFIYRKFLFKLWWLFF